MFVLCFITLSVAQTRLIASNMEEMMNNEMQRTGKERIFAVLNRNIHINYLALLVPILKLTTSS